MLAVVHIQNGTITTNVVLTDSWDKAYEDCKDICEYHQLQDDKLNKAQEEILNSNSYFNEDDESNLWSIQICATTTL